MDISDKIWYYGGLVGIFVALGAIILGALGAVTGSSILLGKGIIGLVICTSCFIRGRRAKRKAELQEWLNRMEAAARNQEEDKGEK